MTYTAEVQFKFDATFTPTYGSLSWSDDDFIPEEHYLITAPAADLNTKQYFKLFEKFLLCVGMCPQSIRSGATSLAFNDMRSVEDMKKVADEYDLYLSEEYGNKVIPLENKNYELEKEVRDLKAKLSRCENPDAEQYTPEEMDAMTYEGTND